MLVMRSGGAAIARLLAWLHNSERRRSVLC
jgi:hypothetical protein